MQDPILDSMLSNLRWKDDEFELLTIKSETIKSAIGRSRHTMDLSAPDFTLSIYATSLRNKGEIQNEILVLKRKTLAFRCKGEIEEVDEILKHAKTLEAQLKDFGN